MNIQKLLLFETFYFRLWMTEKINLLLSIAALLLIILFSYIPGPKHIFAYLYSFLLVQPYLLYTIDNVLKKNKFFNIYGINLFWQEVIKVNFIYFIVLFYIITISIFQPIPILNSLFVILSSYPFAVQLYRFSSLFGKIPILFLFNIALNFILVFGTIYIIITLLLLTVIFIGKILNERNY